MKKFKLNAALASVLSLGVVCNSFAYASEIEEPAIPAEPSTSIESDFKESNAENIEKKFNKYKRDRRVLVCRIESSKEKVDDKELKGLDTYLKDDVLCEVLKELDSLSQDWTPEIKKTFCEKGWEDVPKASYFFDLIAKDKDNCGSLEDNLNGLCEFVQSLPEEFESENTLFSILREIFYEISKKEKPTTPSQPLISVGLSNSEEEYVGIDELHKKLMEYDDICSEKWREVESLEKGIDKKLSLKERYALKIKIEKDAQTELFECLVEITNGLFKCLSSLSENWDPILTIWFNKKGLECFPKQGSEFIKMVENDFNFLSFIMRNINSGLLNAPGLKDEKLLFSTLQLISVRLKRIYNIFELHI